MSWMKYVYILVLQFKGIQLKKGNCIKLFYINPLSQKCCVLAYGNFEFCMKNEELQGVLSKVFYSTATTLYHLILLLLVCQ